ncbi:MAG: hypothetical protein IE880_03605, partial [Epsilonproteobacteria bacterium]|nr:hypothetical protein [Campylobacterota bacterium]
HNGTDFKTVYQNNYAPENKCQTECTSGSDETCYQCLKTYYSQPICSRDNFSVRPYAIELNATNVNSSGKEVLMSKNDSIVKNINLISGDYNYTSSYRPISNPASGNVNTVGYYFRLLANSIRKIANNTLSDMDEFFGLEFNSNKDKCRDTNHIRLTYKQDKPNISPWKIYNDNVGDYNLELIDRNWTMVDQARYKYKTFSGDDCIPNSASSGGMSGLAGCNVQSYDIDKYTKIPVKLIPYKIDVSSVGISSFPNNSNNWVYMNDLSKDKNMAVRFFGTLRSLSRDGKVTSNFTDGCAASDVNLTLDFNSTDFNASKEKSIIAKNLKDNSTALTGPNININRNGEGNSTIYDLNNIKKLNIPSSSFKFENNGTMPLDMRFTITKIWDKVVDPIEILFKNLSLAAERFKAWFNGVENSYAPKDKIVYDRNITFLYGRVLSPIESTGAIEYKDSRNIYLVATAYTSNPTKETNLHKDIFDANNDKVVNSYEGVWCTVEAHSATDIDGRVVDLTDLNTKAAITPDTNILFDSVAPNTSGISSSINVAYPKGGGKTRPYTALIEVNPDIWLKYHPTKTNGNPEFSIKFENLGYNWAGKGKTGNVIKQTISPNSRYKVNW